MSTAVEVKERPILFTGEMVRAILEGRKWQTRRVVKLPSVWSEMSYEQGADALCHGYVQPIPFWRFWASHDGVTMTDDQKCPYGKPGDRLWVKEAFFPDPQINGWPGDIEWNGCGRRINGVPEKYRNPRHILYATTRNDIQVAWRPSIYMPRWASRILLEITEIRVQRVQEISNEDAIAEGCSGGPGVKGYSIRNPSDPYEEFAILWDSINLKRGHGWDANPWVWAISFKRIQP